MVRPGTPGTIFLIDTSHRGTGDGGGRVYWIPGMTHGRVVARPRDPRLEIHRIPGTYVITPFFALKLSRHHTTHSALFSILAFFNVSSINRDTP